MLVVNFFGEPCAGKTAAAAGLFYELKLNYIDAVLVQEAATDYILAGALNSLEDQALVLGEQHNRIWRLLKRGIQVAVVDSPLPLCALYAGKFLTPAFEAYVRQRFESFDNLNIFLTRRHAYKQLNRIHDEDQASVVRQQLRDLLSRWEVPLIEMTATRRLPHDLLPLILNRLSGQKPAEPG